MKNIKMFNVCEMPQTIRDIVAEYAYSNDVSIIRWSHIDSKPISKHKGGKIHVQYPMSDEDYIIEEGDYPDLDWFLDRGMKILEEVCVEW